MDIKVRIENFKKQFGELQSKRNNVILQIDNAQKILTEIDSQMLRLDGGIRALTEITNEEQICNSSSTTTE